MTDEGERKWPNLMHYLGALLESLRNITINISQDRPLYAFGTWPLTLSERHELRMFENWMLGGRGVFESKMEKIT
jgi:hypothetical protein